MRPAPDRPTPYVAGVARGQDQLDAEVDLALRTGRVSLDGLLVQEVLSVLRVEPICSLGHQTRSVPTGAAEAALRALVRAGVVACEHRGGVYRASRTWRLVPGAQVPDLPEVRAEVAPARVAHVVPPKPTNTREAPQPIEAHRFAEWRR